MSGPIKETDITEAIYEIVTDEVGSSEELWPARIAEIANGLIKTGIVSLPTPPCKHWWDYDEGFWASECDEQIDTGEGESPSKYCMSCGGKVEIVEAPEKEGGAE